MKPTLKNLSHSIPLLALCLFATSCMGVVRTVRVTVTEEDGAPIKDADVAVKYLGYQKTTRKEGQSNAQGVFSATGSTPLRMTVGITKDGYYKTHSGRLSRTQDHDVSFMLRKKINPIPLYAKREVLIFRANREWLGYDFESGDWTPPHGQGKTIDLWFKCDTEKIDSGSSKHGKGTLEIKFREDEGLLLVKDDYRPLSIMKMPHLAPQSGYQNFFSRFEEAYYGKNTKRDIGYFIRTRVRKEGGRIVSAHYGKLLKDYKFIPVADEKTNKEPAQAATLYMSYYFNPTPNDRNLEFDTKSNLFTDLDYYVNDP